jgi:hypothetical protein
MTKRLDYTQTTPNGAKALSLLMIAGAISSHYGNHTRSVLENLVPHGDN